jgi:hypothetical protein
MVGIGTRSASEEITIIDDIPTRGIQTTIRRVKRKKDSDANVCASVFIIGTKQLCVGWVDLHCDDGFECETTVLLMMMMLA